MVGLIVPFMADIPFLLGAGLSAVITWKLARRWR